MKEVHQSPNGYCISEDYVWIPGCYADVKTAEKAFDYNDDVLQALQDSLKGGTITYEMLLTLQERK